MPALQCAGRWAALIAAALVCLGLAPPTQAQTGPSAVGLAIQTEGRPIQRVDDVALVRTGGSDARGDAIVARLKTLLAPMEGQVFNRSLVETTLAGPRSRIGTGRIDTRILNAATVGSVVLRIEVDTVAAQTLEETERLTFPTLYRDERSYLTAILGGGFGVYSDGNSWFGRPDIFTQRNPLAGRRPGSRTTWTEGYIEAGLGGATQIGDAHGTRSAH